MSAIRIALANLRFPATPAESVTLAEQAIAQASDARAAIVCFPECFVPGYRAPEKRVPPPDPVFLERAWARIADAAARAGVAVVLGTERVVDGALIATALVINRDGTRAGFQDKVQIDPSEEPIYTPGSGRQAFQAGELTFGIAICHEGWRYPETVRWAARRGAQIVFHPHFHEAEPGGHRPSTFADPANTFHEKAVLCRAAENTLGSHGELRERGFADHVCSRTARWHFALLSAVRSGRVADRRCRPGRCHGTAGVALQACVAFPR
jgi:predicted amidohydrolase